jgi:hypothetical protein
MTTDTNNPFSISVVVPAYNIGPYIARAIESILAQTLQPDEIIIVNDGSTDNTSEEIANFGEKVRCIHQQNGGLSAARNTGIKASTGKWIAFLDGDDEWLPDYLQTQIDLLKRNPELKWSSGNYLQCLCDEDRRKANMDAGTISQLTDGKDYFEDYLSALQKGTPGCANTVIVRTDVFEQAGLFLEGLKRAEDMDMWLRVSCHYPQIGFIAEPLAIYHLVREGCLSRQYTPVELYCDLIERQLEYAKEHERLDKFQPVASWLLQGWMRSFLFDARGDDIRFMLKKFNNIIPAWYKILMQALTVFPKTSAAGCHMISKVVRTLRLRKQLTRKPK